jgi:hypothetical protein
LSSHSPLPGYGPELSCSRLNFRGVTALAYHVGTATGSDGRTYDLEAGVRAMEGTYVAEDGSRKRALFAGL